MEQYLLLGYVTDAFSLDGTLRIISKTDFGVKRYQKDNEVFLFSPKSQERLSFHVEKYRSNGQFDFVKVKEINSKEEALAFKGYEVQALKDYQNLDENTYYFVDLVGCKVADEEGTLLGEVTRVEEFPAQLTLRVKKAHNKGDFFVPFVKAFIKKVDIENKKITINVIGGML